MRLPASRPPALPPAAGPPPLPAPPLAPPLALALPCQPWVSAASAAKPLLQSSASASGSESDLAACRSSRPGKLPGEGAAGPASGAGAAAQVDAAGPAALPPVQVLAAERAPASPQDPAGFLSPFAAALVSPFGSWPGARPESGAAAAGGSCSGGGSAALGSALEPLQPAPTSPQASQESAAQLLDSGSGNGSSVI